MEIYFNTMYLNCLWAHGINTLPLDMDPKGDHTNSQILGKMIYLSRREIFAWCKNNSFCDNWSVYDSEDSYCDVVYGMKQSVYLYHRISLYRVVSQNLNSTGWVQQYWRLHWGRWRLFITEGRWCSALHCDVLDKGLLFNDNKVTKQICQYLTDT